MFINGLGVDFTGILDAGTKIAASAAAIDAARKAAGVAKAEAESRAAVAMYNAQSAEAQSRAGQPRIVSKYATPIKVGLGAVGVVLAYVLYRKISRRRSGR